MAAATAALTRLVQKYVHDQATSAPWKNIQMMAPTSTIVAKKMLLPAALPMRLLMSVISLVAASTICWPSFVRSSTRTNTLPYSRCTMAILLFGRGQRRWLIVAFAYATGHRRNNCCLLGVQRKPLSNDRPQTPPKITNNHTTFKRACQTQPLTTRTYKRKQLLGCFY